jgi:chromate transporter
MDRQEFLTGSGIVRAIPGPVFSIGAFTGGMVMRNNGVALQLVGCFIGTVAIFLPSVLIVLFFFPVWQNIKKYVVIYRSLEGIHAAVVGIMTGATVYLLKDNMYPSFLMNNYLTVVLDLSIVVATFFLLRSNRIPAPFIVVGCLMLGFLV